MKKLIATLTTVFFICTLTGINAWAVDPQPDSLPIDRHSVWTKAIEDNTGQSGTSSQAKSDKTSEQNSEKHSKMRIKVEDLPWQRVG